MKDGLAYIDAANEVHRVVRRRAFTSLAETSNPDKQFVVTSGLEQYPIRADPATIRVAALAQILSSLTI